MKELLPLISNLKNLGLSKVASQIQSLYKFAAFSMEEWEKAFAVFNDLWQEHGGEPLEISEDDPIKRGNTDAIKAIIISCFSSDKDLKDVAQVAWNLCPYAQLILQTLKGSFSQKDTVDLAMYLFQNLDYGFASHPEKERVQELLNLVKQWLALPQDGSDFEREYDLSMEIWRLTEEIEERSFNPAIDGFDPYLWTAQIIGNLVSNNGLINYRNSLSSIVTEFFGEFHENPEGHAYCADLIRKKVTLPRLGEILFNPEREAEFGENQQLDYQFVQRQFISPEILHELIQIYRNNFESGGDILWHILNHKTLSPVDLDDLAKNPPDTMTLDESEVKKWVAKHPNTTLETLEFLVRDPDHSVSNKVFENPKFSKSLDAIRQRAWEGDASAQDYLDNLFQVPKPKPPVTKPYIAEGEDDF